MIWWDNLQLWQQLLIYGFILLAFYIYTKLSRISIGRYPLIPKRYRIIIALLFPFIFALMFFFGTILLSLLLAIIFIASIILLASKKKIKIRKRNFKI